jgi:hypothetical protein
MFEMDEYPPEILVILFDTVIQFLDVSLIKKPQDFFLELSAALAGDDLHQFDFSVNRLFHNAIEFRVYLVSAIVDFVQVEFELCHYFFFSFNRDSKGG